MRRESGDLLEEMYVPACELLGGERCFVVRVLREYGRGSFWLPRLFIFSALLDSEDYKK